MAYASEVELSGMGSVRSMRKQESHEFIRGSVKDDAVSSRETLKLTMLQRSGETKRFEAHALVNALFCNLHCRVEFHPFAP